MMKLDWRGNEVFAQVAAATVLAADATLSAAADHAKRDHEYIDRTGFLSGSVAVLRPAVFQGLKVSGSFGATANYALYVEVGTSRVGATARGRVVASEGWGTIPAPRPAPGDAVIQGFTILPPGRRRGYRTLHRPSVGEGPLKRARAFLRPAGYYQFPLFAFRIKAVLAGTPMSG